MISYSLDSLNSVTNLVNVCEKYKDDLNPRVTYGGQIIDGSSILGVMSLSGNIVGIEVSDNTSDKYNDFLKEIEGRK